MIEALNADEDREAAEAFLEACSHHGRLMLALQLPDLATARFDFSSVFERIGREFFMIGAMWRFAEQSSFPTNARDRAFLCLMNILVADGMNFAKARARVAWLAEQSTNNIGQYNVFITAGYRSVPADGSLASAFEHFRSTSGLSGKAERLLKRFRMIAFWIGLVGGIIASISFAVALPRDFPWYYLSIAAAGFSAFFLFGVAVLLIGAALHSRLTKDQ